MIVEVVGKVKRPYELTDQNGVLRKGMSCRLSVHVGSYETDVENGVFGSGEMYFEVKASEAIFDNVTVGDTLSIDLDDKKTRIKSAMLQVDNGAFMPV